MERVDWAGVAAQRLGLNWPNPILLFVECEYRDLTKKKMNFSNKESVGDGVYLFSQMESVYWIARRYDVPFLLIVLNNGGWNAPKVSALLVHEHGLSSKANRKGNICHPLRDESKQRLTSRYGRFEHIV